MAKSATRKSAPVKSAGAPSKVSAQVFAIGAAVVITNGATGNLPLLCVVEESAKGWYVCRDEAGNKVSARAGSMTLPVETIAAPKAATKSLQELADDAEQEAGDDEEGDPADEEETVGSKMAAALAKARAHYTKCRRPNGTATAHNGDDIAQALRDYEPNEVADLADKCLSQPIGTHFLKYGHLNPGQIRMNSGNKIRGAFAKALKAQDQATIDQILSVLGLKEEADEEVDHTEDPAILETIADRKEGDVE